MDRLAWTDEDDMVVKRLQNLSCPIILAVNKVDILDDKEQLLPHLQALMEKLPIDEVVPISALRGHNLEALEAEVEKRLPEGMHFFPEDQITDRSSRFMAAEIVREKNHSSVG